MNKGKKDKEEIEILANKVKLLFGFCADLIPQKDKIKKVLNIASDRKNFALSAAPILGAMGMDYEKQEFDAELKRKRAKALYNLIDILEQTETERIEFEKKQQAKAKGREQLVRILGA